MALVEGGCLLPPHSEPSFVSSLCPNIQIEKTLSFSQEITGRAEGIPERERDSVWGIRQSGLGGYGNARACPHTGLKLHIHGLILQIDHGKTFLVWEKEVS